MIIEVFEFIEISKLNFTIKAYFDFDFEYIT